jgi:hypothetical protein
MAVTLTSTGVKFPDINGSPQVQTTAAPFLNSDIPIMMSQYIWDGVDANRVFLNDGYQTEALGFTRVKLGSLAQAPQIWGNAEFDPVNDVWRIKKAGYYFFSVFVKISPGVYYPYNPVTLKRLNIYFTTKSGGFVSEMENDWNWYGSDGGITVTSLGSVTSKTCNFNRYCAVDEEIAAYVFVETASQEGHAYYVAPFLIKSTFSGFMHRP